MPRISFVFLLTTVCVFTGCNRSAYRQPSLEGHWMTLKEQPIVDYTIDFFPGAYGSTTDDLTPTETPKVTLTNLNRNDVPDGVAALMPENTAMVLLDIKKEQAIAIRFGNGDGDLVGGFAGTWTRRNPSQIDVDLGEGKEVRLHLLDPQQLLMTDGSGKAIRFVLGNSNSLLFLPLLTDSSAPANLPPASLPESSEAPPSH